MLGKVVALKRFEAIQVMADEGLPVQGVTRILGVSDYGYVMEMGEMRLSGTAAELEADALVQDAYLGT